MEFKFRDRRFKTNRMNLMTEAKLAKRLIPILGSMKALSQAWGAATEALIAAPGDPAEVRKRIEESFSSQTSIWDEFADALRTLPDEDLAFIINECMAVLERQDQDGVGGWSKVWDPVTHRPYFQDINLGQVLGLVSIVLQSEFQDFFA